MMTKAISSVALVGLAALSLTGCAGSPESGGEEDVATVQEAFMEDNGLEWNGLLSNGLLSNGLLSNGLLSNGLVTTALTDPMARMFFKYVASCALPADKHIDLTIDNVLYSFPGSMGLAPAWGVTGGSCDENCRSWVSACVLSRVNFLGEHIPLSIRGRAGPLGSDSTERNAYPNREAAYYGDVFSVPQKRFVCKSPGSSLIARSCGPVLSDCVIKVVGDCDQVCSDVDADGSFDNCRDDQGTIYGSTVTVFRLPP
jgi:hypothetical protein